MINSSLLDWLFNKDNPPNDKDNPSDIKMSSTHSDPKTVRFVSTPATDQPPINSTTCTKNDDKFLKKMARALTAWGYNNDNPPDDIMMGKVVNSLLPSFVTREVARLSCRTIRAVMGGCGHMNSFAKGRAHLHLTEEKD